MNLDEELTQCLVSYASDDLYVLEWIPPDKLSNAIQSFPIDSRDTVLALLDATLMGSNKNGMAFGMRGVYWKNDWTTKTQRHFMPWEELSTIKHLIGPKSFEVHLGPGNSCNLSSCSVGPRQAANLLHQLIDIYNDYKASLQESGQGTFVEPQNVSATEDTDVAVPLKLTASDSSTDHYSRGLPKALAIMICADNELTDAEVELAVQFLEVDDGISNKAAAIESLTILIEELRAEFARSRPLFKLKCSKLIAQMRDEIVGSSREHVRLMLHELLEQVKTTDNSANTEMHDKLVAALAD